MRTVEPERKDSGPQHFKNVAQLFDQRLGRPSHDLPLLLPIGIAVVKPGLKLLDLGVVLRAALFHRGPSRQVRVRELAREALGRLLRVVSRREHPFGAREMREAATEKKALAQFLGLLVGLRAEDRLQVAEVLGTRLVTLITG